MFSVTPVIRQFAFTRFTSIINEFSKSSITIISMDCNDYCIWTGFASIGYALFWEEYEEVVIAGKNEYQGRETSSHNECYCSFVVEIFLSQACYM